MEVKVSPKSAKYLSKLDIEADLTSEEKAIISAGREEYKKSTFVLLEDI
ncbi:MAG: hypothetical protein FWG83_03575 [Oscillospiraceae bacterium]|nr:hypothetical protein [Oscillospiraceae bacterium]